MWSLKALVFIAHSMAAAQNNVCGSGDPCFGCGCITPPIGGPTVCTNTPSPGAYWNNALSQAQWCDFSAGYYDAAQSSGIQTNAEHSPTSCSRCTAGKNGEGHTVFVFCFLSSMVRYCFFSSLYSSWPHALPLALSSCGPCVPCSDDAVSVDGSTCQACSDPLRTAASSRDACVCKPGRGGSVCALCPVGKKKDAAGNGECNSCEPTESMWIFRARHHVHLAQTFRQWRVALTEAAASANRGTVDLH